MPFTAYGDTVIAYGEIVLIDWRPAALAVEVNEWCYAVCFAVFIERVSVMCRIQQEFLNMKFREVGFHGEKGMQE